MNPSLTLEGKTIWITGGAGYLGSVITRELDAQCAKVVCFDLPGRAEALVREHALARTVPRSLDVNDAEALPAALDAAIAAHGLPDGVAHLAFASSSGHRVENLPAAEFQKTFDLALTPTFVFCRALAEKMKVRGSGSIVLFSSMYGVVAPDPRIYREPMTPNPIDYGASKAAILQLSRYLAVHYGPAGIRFNCITPGPFPSPGVQQAHPGFIGDLAKKTALNRVGRNHEIVGPTLFLLTDSASFVTGHSLVVEAAGRPGEARLPGRAILPARSRPPSAMRVTGQMLIVDSTLTVGQIARRRTALHPARAAHADWSHKESKVRPLRFRATGRRVCRFPPNPIPALPGDQPPLSHDDETEL